MQRKSNQIKSLENLTLNVNEIEELIDSASITDEIVDYIAERYKNELTNSHQFQRIQDLLNLNDLTKFDEKNIEFHLSKAAKRSFCSLILAGKLSKLEIVYFIKNRLVSDNDLITILKSYDSKDFVHVLLRWNPIILEKFQDIRKKYEISDEAYDKYKRKMLNLEKFLYISDESQ